MTVQSTDDKNEQQFHLDGILSELGSFGKYQLLLLLLLAFRDSFLNMCNYNFVFSATDIPFRCNVSQYASTLVSFNSSWASYTISNSSCYLLLSTWNSSCSPATSDRNRTVHCSDIIYENYNSIVAEFDLGCQPWKRTLIGTVHNLGLAVSFIISGIISDRYGRKVIIVGSPLIVGAAGLLKSVVIDYWSLLTLEFIETALGYGNASLVLALEVVSQKNRVAFSCILDILGSIGGAFFGLIAWKIPYWRNLMRAIYAPLLIVVFYTFLMDEGVRWLLAHNRIDEAVYVLNRVAKINNITLSIKSKEMLTKISVVDKIKADEMDLSVPVGRPSVLSVLKSKTIFIRMVIIATSFFCCMFLFVGTIVNSTTFSGDQYVNFSAMMLVAVPTRIAIALTLTRFGRRAPICLAYCLCAIFFIVSAFVPKSITSAKSTMSWETALLYMASICSNYGFFSMLMVALEVFPTTSRNSLTNIANTIGRLGSALAPQTPLLEQYYPGLPNMVYGLAALGPALLALFLPDTSQTDLPDRIVDAENIGCPKNRKHDTAV